MMYETILTFIKFNNFGTRHLNKPSHLFHSFCCTTWRIFEPLRVYEPGFNMDKYGMYVFMYYVCMHACMHVYRYVCMYVCMYLCNVTNLGNYPWFTKLKPFKLVLIINNLLADLLIHQTFFHQMLEKINLPNFSTIWYMYSMPVPMWVHTYTYTHTWVHMYVHTYARKYTFCMHIKAYSCGRLFYTHIGIPFNNGSVE